MKILKKRVLFACILILIPLMANHIAYACDCMGPRTAALQLEKSAVAGIFKLQSIDTEQGPGSPYPVYRPKFTVEKVFKGPIKAGDEIILSPPRNNCDRLFTEKDVGVRFLFYIRENPADNMGLWVHLCSRSGPASRLKKELKELEKITGPGQKKPI